MIHADGQGWQDAKEMKGIRQGSITRTSMLLSGYM
jgi:hypothetical protein